MSTSFERLLGIMIVVITGLALSLGFLAALPGMAEAQDMAEAQQVEAQVISAASMEAEQNTTTYEKGAPAVWEPTPEPSTKRLVVELGESLWSISEEHLGPGATPQQTAYEVNRIFELNREQIGEDPNLIFPGQEFVSVPPVPNATASSIPEEPVGSEEPTIVTHQLAPKPIVVESEGASDPPVAEDVAAEDGVIEEAIPDSQTPDPTDEQAENASAENASAENASDESAPSTAAGGIAGSLLEAYDNIEADRRLLGIGILALTLIVAILMALRLPMRRNVEDPAAWGIPEQYYDNYARPEPTLEVSSETSSETSSEAPTEETARRPEGEPSSSPASEVPSEEPTGGPDTTISDTPANNIPTGRTEGALPVGASSVAPARSQEQRLRKARHLKRIRQRRSPTSW